MPEVQGYKPVSFRISDSSQCKIHPAVYPRAEMFYLEAIKERVPVYKNQVRFTRDITPRQSMKTE